VADADRPTTGLRPAACRIDRERKFRGGGYVIPNEAPGNVPWWHLQRAFLDMDDGARGLKRRPLAPNPHPRLNSL
jgi:hypothetical protein